MSRTPLDRAALPGVAVLLRTHGSRAGALRTIALLALLAAVAGCTGIPAAVLAQPAIGACDARTQLGVPTPSGATSHTELTYGTATAAPANDVEATGTASETAEQPRAGVAVYQLATVLSTYPMDAYRSAQVDAEYNWPYLRFDRERFLEDGPRPVNQAYRVIVLENELLRLLILPDLGGRIWQVVHKPSGHTMFYQNTVVKPSPWGPANQLGWMALGGLEWNVPVVEHGYDWGTRWDTQAFVDANGVAVARISTPSDGRSLNATITVSLPPGAAYFDIEPHIQNNSDAPLDFDYWHTAMLAPGPGNQPSPELRFIIPGRAVRIHSTGDERLPSADRVISWPRYGTRDLSRLGDWDQYLGFFEYPAAHGPFVGVYDPAGDTGAARVYPPEVARGSKVFGLGWHDALTSEYYTDDGSAYVELHGGLSTTFTEPAHLETGESVRWSERWYPVHGIGQFATAGEAGALSWKVDQDTLTAGFYPSQPFTGRLAITSRDGQEIAQQHLSAPAGVPVSVDVDLAGADASGLVISLHDAHGTATLSATVESP